MLPCDVLMGLKATQNVLLIAPNTQLGVNFKVGAAELVLIYRLSFTAASLWCKCRVKLTVDRGKAGVFLSVGFYV